MSRSVSKREQVADARLSAADLREWIEDWVGVTRSHRFDECVAALRGAGCLLPPSDGWERLQKVFDEVQAQVLDNLRY